MAIILTLVRLIPHFLAHRADRAVQIGRVIIISGAPFLFCFQCYGDHRDLHSFPTRRSSDLANSATRTQTENAPTQWRRTAYGQLRTSWALPLRYRQRYTSTAVRRSSRRVHRSTLLFHL